MLALYQVVIRTGWIFKTESVIMPAVLDTLGGGAWLRGCLPLLNRFGQSVPPLLMARRINVTPRKMKVLFASTSCMAGSFLALAAIWGFSAAASWWAPVAFLVLYALFFMGVGVNQLTMGTLQGKLIPATSRGRLLMCANVTGAVCAVTAAGLLLPLWLGNGENDFGRTFGFAGICFGLGAVSVWLLREPADDYRQPRTSVFRVFSGAARVLKKDANFRRAAVVSALFGTSMMLFPHYQALALQSDYRLERLIGWVIVQNIGTGLFSLPIGPLADRRGNRLVLKVLLLGVTVAPLLALALGAAGESGQSWFVLVFLLVGTTPVTIRTLHNYTLEISRPADHPRYLSTLSFCMSAPIVLSPLAGLAVDAWGFTPLFIAVCSLVGLAWGLTFRLEEPRYRTIHDPDQAVIGDAP